MARAQKKSATVVYAQKMAELRSKRPATAWPEASPEEAAAFEDDLTWWDRAISWMKRGTVLVDPDGRRGVVCEVVSSGSVLMRWTGPDAWRARSYMPVPAMREWVEPTAAGPAQPGPTPCRKCGGPCP